MLKNLQTETTNVKKIECGYNCIIKWTLYFTDERLLSKVGLTSAVFSISPFSKEIIAYLTLWRIFLPRGKLFFAWIAFTKTLSAIRWNETWAFIFMFVASLPCIVNNQTSRASFIATLFIYWIIISANSTLIINNHFFLSLTGLKTFFFIIWDSNLTIVRILITSLVFKVNYPSFRAFCNTKLLTFRVLVLEFRAANLTYCISLSLFNEFILFAWTNTVILISWYYMGTFFVLWITLQQS